MKKFCLECGHEAGSADRICTECGTPFDAAGKKEQVQRSTIAKAPMSKKKKVMTGSIALLVVLLIGGYMYGNSYASAENTVKRFHEAVLKKDQARLGKLVVFEDESTLSKGELDAIIKFGEKEPNEFTKSIGEWDFGLQETSLFAVKQTGKVLGVFNGHKLMVPNQFVSVPFPNKELVYSLNGQEMEVDAEDGQEHGVIGPVAPGIYELNVDFKNDFIKYDETKELALLSTYNDIANAPLDFNLTSVEFVLSESAIFKTSETKLLIGDKELAFDENGKLEEKIPLPTDGSVKVKLKSKLPWGEVKSAGIVVDDAYMSILFNGLDKETEKKLGEMIVKYGEEIIEARAVSDVKPLTAVTDNIKEEMNEIYRRDQTREDYFSGQLDEVQVDFERVTTEKVDDNIKAYVPVSLITQEKVSSDGEGELEKTVNTCTMEIIYEKEAWKVDRCQKSWYSDKVEGTVLAGSKKLHKPTGMKKKEETTKSTETEASSEDFDHGTLESFMQSYNNASVEAINNNNFSQVSNKIMAGSPREKEQSDYIAYLNSKGITEDHISTSLSSVKKVNQTTVEVTTKETFNIHYKDKDSVKNTYTTVTELKLVNGEWKVNKLISTK